MIADFGRATAPAFQENPKADQLQFFEKKIRPLLLEHCIDCHGDQEPESGLSLESRESILKGGELGPAIIPGEPARSLLIRAINHDEFLKMPPREKLSTAGVVDLTRWVRMGAPWPVSKRDSRSTPLPPGPATNELPSAETTTGFSKKQKTHWSFQPLTRPPLPLVRNRSWAKQPIDLFVLRKLEEQGLKPAGDADRASWIRRATLDLTGLPPAAAEIEAFLNDDSPLAFETVVNRLLASPRYGEKWGRHWLDVARFADSNGLDENLSYANAYRYRDYVIRAFNLDKPFDQFVREQIAGDLLPSTPASPATLEGFDPHIATGFLAIGPKMLAEDDPVKMQMDIIDEQLSTLGQAFLAMTLGCARCHDHKFDPIPTDDYYSLAGIFKSTKTMENHKVVAVWYERQLASDLFQQKLKQHLARLKQAKGELERLVSGYREKIRKEIRTNLAQILWAARKMPRFDQDSPEALATGVTRSGKPILVKNGYARFEAEAFHRGNLNRDTTQYGKQIGVANSRGAAFGEYDLDVEHAGRYVIEISYAAADSRPFQLLLNGQPVASKIAANTTGSWYPDTQKWFAEAEMNLPAGKNILKIDSPGVYPHLDKFALVYKPEGQWPFGTPPYAISLIGSVNSL
ncbi:MAG: DUF1549 domain-containing protein, partial [Planctomycetota bacterium]|nr:DUF1549 domain-containing protein [Planctomycetota bacterium]